jgi:hypothetical protein
MLNFLKGQVVQAAVRTLAAMLVPGAGFIGALLAIWETIKFFRQKLSQIIQVATNFLSAIAAIASGNIAAAASRVERTMAGMLVLVINFLARIARIGNVTTAIMNLIRRIRTPVEQGLDRVVTFVVAQARRLGRFVAQAGVPNDPAERLRLAARDSTAIARTLTGRVDAAIIERALAFLRTRYALTTLSVRREAQGWMARASINPELVWRLPLPGETAGTGGIREVADQTGPGGVRETGVRGELLPGMDRDAPTTPNYNEKMPRTGNLVHHVEGYQWAHAWGPGFGDEARIGMMLASRDVNQRLQSFAAVYGLEGYLSRLRDATTRTGHRAFGARIFLQVKASSFPDPPPGLRRPIGQPLLREVKYVIAVQLANGQRFGGTAGIRAGAPRPRGTGGLGESFGNFRDLYDEFAV